MKTIVRNVLVHALSLAALPYLFEGVRITGGITTYILAGTLLTLMSFIIKPILNLITLPINMMTFGLFSILTNTFILYLLTVIMTRIRIDAFVFKGFEFYGFVIPNLAFNVFFAYLMCALVLSVITTFIDWLIK